MLALHERAGQLEADLRAADPSRPNAALHERKDQARDALADAIALFELLGPDSVVVAEKKVGFETELDYEAHREALLAEMRRALEPKRWYDVRTVRWDR